MGTCIEIHIHNILELLQHSQVVAGVELTRLLFSSRSWRNVYWIIIIIYPPFITCSTVLPCHGDKFTNELLFKCVVIIIRIEPALQRD